MTYGTSQRNHRKRLKSVTATVGGKDRSIISTIVSSINAFSQHLPGFLQGPFRIWVRLITAGPYLLIREWTVIFHALEKLWAWLLFTLPKWIRREIAVNVSALKKWTANKLAALRRLIWRLYHRAIGYATILVRRERRARVKADQAVKADARAWDKALHQQIEREAVSGYKAGRSDRLALIQRVADLIIVDDPVVKTLVRDLVGGVLDLATVDDPVARIALSFVIKHVINHLGIDKPIGHLLQSLLAPILGQPRPNGLSSVIADLCARLAALEGNWADFMAAGGPEVEQAGSEWKALDSPLVDVGILAFFGLAATDPTAWARDVSDTVGTLITGPLIEVTDLIMKG